MAENYKFVNYAGAEMAELFDKIADLDVATQSKAGLMSDTDKTKLDNLPAGAQVNVLEGVQLAGTDLSISDKKVNIPVDNAPTEGSSALIRSGAVFSALAGIHQFRVVIVTELPASGEELVLYLVGPTGTGPDKYEEYLWNNNAWVKIGDTSLDISGKADKDTDAVAGNLAEFDANGNPVDSGIAKGKIAEIEGKVTELGTTAGISEGIADSTSAGTAQEIVFRQSGGDGVNYVKRFKGKTLVWNQLKSADSKYQTINCAVTKDGDIASMTASAQDGRVVFSAPSIVINNVGHKYYISVFVKTSASASNVVLRISGNPVSVSVASNEWQRLSCITESNGSVGIADSRSSGWDAILIDARIKYIDLTLMFGSGNEPSTVEEFEAMFPEAYYPYNAGTLISNDAEELETVGFNQYNPETGKANVIGGKEYYIGGTYTSISQDGETITPSSGIFTPTSTGEVVVVGGNATDTIINLSDASKNGTYEPYRKNTLNLGLDSFKVKDAQGNVITITGGLKSAGAVYDEIRGGKYIKRVGSVDMGTLTWTSIGTWANTPKSVIKAAVAAQLINSAGLTLLGSGIATTLMSMTQNDLSINVNVDGNGTNMATKLSGKYLNYELATPIEYDLAESIPNAILCDEDGTEQAIFPTHEDGSPSAPLCTDSNYSISVKNLLAKLNE